MPEQPNNVSVARDAATVPPAVIPQVQQLAWLEYLPTWYDPDDPTLDWVSSPWLIPLECELHSASAGVSRLTFAFEYGPGVLEPGVDVELAAIERIDLRNCWVRLALSVDGQSVIYPFVGLVKKPDEAVQGDQVADADGHKKSLGQQVWTALGGETLLDEIQIHTSHWLYSDGTTRELGWLAGVNLQAGQSELDASLSGRGNRSATTSRVEVETRGITVTDDRVFAFGGTARWSVWEYVYYLLARHAQFENGPLWWLSGPAVDALKTSKRSLQLENAVSLGAAVRALIDSERGYDYQVVYVEDGNQRGFEIRTFSLLDKQDAVPPPVEEAGLTLFTCPANANVTRLNVTDKPHLRARLEYCGANLFDKIRLVGDRIKSVLSLGAGAVGGTSGPSKLIPYWLSSEETAYKAGTGTPADDYTLHDLARSADRFRAVFQSFGLDPSVWTWQGGKANPRIAPADGTIHFDAGYQRFEFFGLEALLLEAGVDYSTAPPSNRRLPGQPAEYLPPLLIVQDPESGLYLPGDRINEVRPNVPSLGVTPLTNRLGIQLAAAPNHVVDRTRWLLGSPAASNYDPDAEGFGVDYETFTVTLAALTDQRLELEFALPAELRAGNGQAKEVSVPIGQFWWLAPQTVIDVSAAGAYVKSPATSTYRNGQGQSVSIDGVILRDDRNLLASLAAGAIARYVRQRVRASVTSERLEGWHTLLGGMLELQGQQKQLDGTRSPVTTVRWDFRAQTTEMYCGHSGRAA